MGETEEQVFVGAGTGAATGAIIGSIVPGIGTAAGAGAGALIGGLSGWMNASGAKKQARAQKKAMAEQEQARIKSIMQQFGAKMQADSLSQAGVMRPPKNGGNKSTGSVGAGGSGTIGSSIGSTPTSGTF